MFSLIKKHMFNTIILLLAFVCMFMWWGVISNYTSDAQEHYNFSSISTDEDAVKFFGQFGWKITPKLIEKEYFAIPNEFDNVYREYNKLQKRIGLDLEKYKGKEVERRSYEVINHPKSSTMPVRGNILIYQNNVIAGDIMSVQLDGFIHSLLGE